MLAALIVILRDPMLRMVTLALVAVGAVAATLAPYASLIGIGTFGLPDRVYAAALMTASLLAVGSSLLVGVITDRSGSWRLMARGAAALMAAGCLLMLLAPGRGMFLLTHALILPLSGSLFGQVFALARIAAADRPAALRDRIMAIIRAAFALPFILVLPVWSRGIASGWPLLSVYAGASAAALVALALLVFGWPEGTRLPGPSAGPRHPLRDLADSFRAQVLLRVAIIGMARAPVALYMVLLGLVLTGAGREKADVALFAALVAGLEVPFMLLAAQALGRFRKAQVIAGGTCVYALFLVLFAQADATGPIFLLTVPAAMGAAVLLSLPIGYLQDLMADRPGAGGALISLNQFATDVMAAGLFALGVALGGYRTAALLGAAVCLAGGLALVLADRDRRVSDR